MLPGLSARSSDPFLQGIRAAVEFRGGGGAGGGGCLESLGLGFKGLMLIFVYLELI